MEPKEKSSQAVREQETSEQSKKPAKTQMKRGGHSDSSGGSREGNAGQEGGKEGSFGNR